jgi:hypothetical protein
VAQDIDQAEPGMPNGLNDDLAVCDLAENQAGYSVIVIRRIVGSFVRRPIWMPQQKVLQALNMALNPPCTLW